MACSTRRIVDSLGTTRPRPSRIRTPAGRSWAHSANAVNVRAPASTAQHPDRQDRGQAMAHTPTLARIGDLGQRFQQADRVRIQVIGGRAEVG